MSDTTEIEKKSLEAHVELCAERYRFIEEKLDGVEGKIAALKTVVNDVHGMVQKMSDKRNDQLLAWSLGLLGMSIATIAWLLTHYVLK